MDGMPPGRVSDTTRDYVKRLRFRLMLGQNFTHVWAVMIC